MKWLFELFCKWSQTDYNVGRALRPKELPRAEVKFGEIPNKKFLSIEDLKKILEGN